MTWQGGGGYGDPLTRDPAAVARDVREQKVTVDGARTVYGVVIDDAPDGPTVNTEATTAERDQQRVRRRERSRRPGDSLGRADLSSARRLDDNLVEVSGPGDPAVACRHCGEVLGSGSFSGFTAVGGPHGSLAVATYDGPPAEAGPQILADAADYIDAPVVFRQYCCPNCWTALYSAVVPAS